MGNICARDDEVSIEVDEKGYVNITELDLTELPMFSLVRADLLKPILYLDVSRNTLRHVSGIHKLDHLEIVDLTDNDFHEAEDILDHLFLLPHISGIILASNSISQIPSQISKFSTLKILNFSNNLLTSLPPEINDLDSLIVLDLSQNQIATLVPLKHLLNLLHLDLSHNLLTQLSSSFLKGNDDLQKLYLSNNLLTSVPSRITDFLQLTHLDLSYNKIESLPDGIFDLFDLKYLNFEKNLIFKVQHLRLRRLKHLEYLNFKHNPVCFLLNKVYTSSYKITKCLERMEKEEKDIQAIRSKDKLSRRRASLDSLYEIDLQYHNLMNRSNIPNSPFSPHRNSSFMLRRSSSFDDLLSLYPQNSNTTPRANSISKSTISYFSDHGLLSIPSRKHRSYSGAFPGQLALLPGGSILDLSLNRSDKKTPSPEIDRPRRGSNTSTAISSQTFLRKKAHHLLVQSNSFHNLRITKQVDHITDEPSLKSTSLNSIPKSNLTIINLPGSIS